MNYFFENHRRSAITAALCAALALLPILLAGCGGSGSSNTTPAAISVSLSPVTAALSANSTQSFAASVANDSAGVTWSLSGSGALSNNSATSVLYTAPSSVAGTTTATLTATSKTDPTKSASAVITLNPIMVSVNPTSVTLSGGGLQAFTATLTNDLANAGVTWSIGSGAGTLASNTTSSVIYYAPTGLITSTSYVTLTATSKSDPTRTATAAITLAPATAPSSQWVYYNGSGSLVYKTLTNADNTGADGYDQIMDFSTAGYNQGAGALPTVAQVIAISPSGDTSGLTDTAAIQNAINFAATQPLSGGFRGAVVLAAGNFYVNSILNINASGVVLRGAGSGTGSAGNTIINMVAATTPYPLIVLGPYTTSGCSSSTTCSSASPTAGSSTTITDAYVPAGATTLHLSSAANFPVGTNVFIERPVTQNWINFMDMNPTQLISSGQCSGGPCSWISVGNTGYKTFRTIASVNGNTVTLDAPMSDSIDSVYTGSASIYAYSFPAQISNVGVENLYVIAPVPLNNLVPPTNSYQLLVTYSVLNGWARNLAAKDTLQSVDIENYTKQFTVSNVAITHTVTQTASAEFMEFYINGSTQILMDGVSTTADNMYFFSTSSATQGPNVLRNGNFTGSLHIEPHQRWATGLLIENTSISADSGGQGNIKLTDRGDYGTGQGWDIGWGVVWNSSAAETIIQAPPGSMNWCIGCIGISATQTAPGGAVVTQGDIDSQGTNVYPASLYQAQLTQRLGMGYIAQ